MVNDDEGLLCIALSGQSLPPAAAACALSISPGLG